MEMAGKCVCVHPHLHEHRVQGHALHLPEQWARVHSTHANRAVHVGVLAGRTYGTLPFPPGPKAGKIGELWRRRKSRSKEARVLIPPRPPKLPAGF